MLISKVYISNNILLTRGEVISKETDKIKKIKKNVINRHEWDDVKGTSITEDFLQLSQIAEELKDTNKKVYNVFMSLFKQKIEVT